jgi:hypothetical protein
MKIEEFRRHLDVAISATIRPEVLDLTLFSFYKHFLGQFGSTRLIVNVDPLGVPGGQAAEVLAVCQRFTPHVTSRCPATPSFASAVKWCWEQVASAAFLHLEDDWLLRRTMPVERVHARLMTHERVAAVRFNLTRNPRADPPVSDALSFNPSVFRTEFLREALPRFDCAKDPEKQFRSVPELAHWQFLYYGAPGESACVVDIGKKWRRLHDFQKWQPGSGTMAWNKGAASSSSSRRLFYRLKYRFFMLYWRHVTV